MRRLLTSSVVYFCLSLILKRGSILVKCHVEVSDTILNLILEDNLASNSVAPSSCEKACLSLFSILDDAIYIGQTGENFDFWDAKKRELIPACRVEPNDSKDVSLILRALTAHDCHFTIKSGGHERGTPGANSHQDGVVIDLARMKGFEVAENKKSVKIGPGWRWADLYQALEEVDLMVLGGRLGEVGVGGLLLGGGISFHSNWRGLACDSIISFEVILPNATIVTVDQQTQPQLYRALRGGGPSSFGIIKSFELETFPQRQIWYILKGFSWEILPELLEANHQITTKTMNVDPHIAVMNVFMCYPQYHLCFANILAQHMAHNSTASWPTSFQPYEKIAGYPEVPAARLGTMSNLTALDSGPSSRMRHRTIYATFTYRPSIALEQQLLAIFREEAEHTSLRDVTGWLPGIIMHPFSRNMLANTRKRGGNAFSAAVEYEDALTVANIGWQWDEKMDDEVAYASYYRTIERLENAAKEMGLWHPYKYINYAEAAQDVFAYRTEDQNDELRRLQEQLDSSGIFAQGGLLRSPFATKGASAGFENSKVPTIPVTSIHKDEL